MSFAADADRSLKRSFADGGVDTVDIKRQKLIPALLAAPDRYSSIRTFIVGPEQVPYAIHEDQLRAKLGEASQRDGWYIKDAAAESSDIFEKFITWLYTGKVPPSQPVVVEEEDGGERLVEGQKDAVRRYADLDLVFLWLFGARNNIPSLFNTALSLLAKQNTAFKRTTSKEAVEEAFKYTGPRKMLQRYLLDEAACCLDTAPVPKNSASFPIQYIAGVLDAVVARNALDYSAGRNPTPLWVANPCAYHSHGNCGKSPALRLKQISCRKHWLAGGPTDTLDPGLSLMFSSTLRILVGPKATPFVVHKDLLCSKSKYFTGAFTSGFAEGKSQTLTLESESVICFQMFVDWLYAQKLIPIHSEEREALESDIEDCFIATGEPQKQAGPSGDKSTDGAPSAPMSTQSTTALVVATRDFDMPLCVHEDDILAQCNATTCRQWQSDLIDLYIFADRRQVHSLKDAVMSKLIENRLNCWPLLSTSPQFVDRIFRELPPSAKLCDLIAEEAAFCWTGESKREGDFLAGATDMPQEFLGRVLQFIFHGRLQEKLQVPRFRKDICSYHEHDKGEETKCRSLNRALQQRASIGPYNMEMGIGWSLLW